MHYNSILLFRQLYYKLTVRFIHWDLRLIYQYLHAHNALFTFWNSQRESMPRQYNRKRQGPKWNAEDLKAALEQIKSNGTTISVAAARFGIPKTTLHAHLRGFRQKVGAGRMTILTPRKEKEIVVSLQVLQEMGYPLTCELAAGVIHDYLKDQIIPNPFADDLPGRDWWAGFFSRWKRLGERKAQHLSVKRARAVTPKVVDAWIADVKKLFQESGLIELYTYA